MRGSFLNRAFKTGILLAARRSLSLVALACLVVLPIGLTQKAGADDPGVDLIAKKYKELGGSAGVLGRPTSKVMDSKEGKGRYQTFEHGVIGWSPATGKNSMQVLYAKSHDMVFEWGDTTPFSYKSFLVRWDLDGKNVGQEEVKGGSSGRWVTRPSKSGRYRLVVEGRDGTKSRQGWSNALYLDFVLQAPIATKYKELGGPAGVLGRPTSKEMDSKEGKGRYQTFEHGVIGWSPSTGPTSVQAVYVQKDGLVFEWGDTRPYNYDFFLVRCDLNGVNVEQEEIKGGSRTSGRWVTSFLCKGRYRFVVEGRDGTKSRQGWSNPLYFDYTPPPPDLKKRPLYVIAHRCNSPKLVMEAVAAGANAIECDPRWGKPPRAKHSDWFLEHDFIHPWSQQLGPWLDAVAAAAKKYCHFTLLYLDIKTHDQDTILLLHTLIRAKVPATLTLLFSQAKYDCRFSYTKILSKLDRYNGLTMDYENDPAKVEKMFSEELKVTNCWYGNGIFEQSDELGLASKFGPEVERSIAAGCKLRDKNGKLKKVYVWTLARADSIDRYFRVHKVDGVFVDPPLVRGTIRIALKYGRLATRDDSPWVRFKP